ncbi:kinase-like domain-containing protein [Biscogniauxia mediterranea]|nr:kinase-like domain-containing protein [Biscogniauxia mediterranea]
MSFSTNMDELVRKSKLETELHPEHHITIHHILCDGQKSQQVWVRGDSLGEGGYGTVWIEKLKSGKDVGYQVRAVKVLKKKPGLDYNREIGALAMFSQGEYAHCFVKFYGWYEIQGTLSIVTEYCEHGDLQSHLITSLPEDHCQHIIWQVLQGLIYMHERHFAHRDLKPSNILVKKRPPKGQDIEKTASDGWHVKICDMGLSKMIKDQSTFTQPQGTLPFLAPERRFTESPEREDPLPADMWNLGEIAFNILTGKATFDGDAQAHNYFVTGKGFPTKPLENVGASKTAINFIQSIMRPTPTERLSAGQASRHLWMDSVIPPSNLERDPPIVDIDEIPPCAAPSMEWKSWSYGSATQSTYPDYLARAASPPSPSTSEASEDNYEWKPLRWRETQKEVRSELLPVAIASLSGETITDHDGKPLRWKETQKAAQRKLASALFTSLLRRIDE